MVEIGARLEITRDGATTPVNTRFRFTQAGVLDSPPSDLPGDGFVALTGLDPQTGSIRLAVATENTGPLPARLSVDVTKKPLIRLVWYGLYVILIGGAISTWRRYRTASQVDEIADRVAAASA